MGFATEDTCQVRRQGPGRSRGTTRPPGQSHLSGLPPFLALVAAKIAEQIPRRCRLVGHEGEVCYRVVGGAPKARTGTGCLFVWEGLCQAACEFPGGFAHGAGQLFEVSYSG